MDQLSAHIDRGWELAERGDAVGSQASAKKALEINPDSPEAYNLLGFVSALGGDCDEAIEAYQHAAMLDDTYVEAMLNAAELLLHPIGDADAAIAMCNQALDVTNFPEEMLEARLLTLEAFLLKGDREQARELLETVTRAPLENPTHRFLAARAWIELDEHELAAPLLAAAIEADPDNAEAHYYQGLLFERLSQRQDACAAYLRTRQLDLEQGLPPWAPNAESFLMFAQRAVEQLDSRLAPYAAHAEVYIADVPGSEMVVDGVDPRALAMVDIGYGELSPDGPPDAEQLNTRIFLYALNVLRVASGLHNVQQCMHDALQEELSATIDDLEAMGQPDDSADDDSADDDSADDDSADDDSADEASADESSANADGDAPDVTPTSPK